MNCLIYQHVKDDCWKGNVYTFLTPQIVDDHREFLEKDGNKIVGEFKVSVNNSFIEARANVYNRAHEEGKLSPSVQDIVDLVQRFA